LKERGENYTPLSRRLKEKGDYGATSLEEKGALFSWRNHSRRPGETEGKKGTLLLFKGGKEIKSATKWSRETSFQKQGHLIKKLLLLGGVSVKEGRNGERVLLSLRGALLSSNETYLKEGVAAGGGGKGRRRVVYFHY